MKNFIGKLRKAAVFGCSLLCLLISARSLFLAATQPQGIIKNLIIAALILVLSFAIFRQYRWALLLTAAIFLLVAILLPIVLFSPFIAGDYITSGREPPTVAENLLTLIPIEVLLLLIIFFIDPRKKKQTSKDLE